MSETTIVDYLHLVRLSLKATVPDGPGTDPAKRELSFIYGIGTQGLCAFEQRLYGKVPGDTLSARIDASNLALEYEHLGPWILQTISSSPPLDLDIEIVAVRKASELEVVKALARQGESGGCSGGCGGGCGSGS